VCRSSYSRRVLDRPFLAAEAVAVAVSEIWRLKAGRQQCQRVRVDVKAALNSITGLNNIYQSGHILMWDF